MIGRGRSTLFSLSASISYTLAYYFDWPLFRYYPTVNEVHLFPQGPQRLRPSCGMAGWRRDCCSVPWWPSPRQNAGRSISRRMSPGWLQSGYLLLCWYTKSAGFSSATLRIHKARHLR